MLALVLAAAFLTAEPDAIRGPLVVSERWPDCTSLDTWTRDVMRLEGVEHASETAQGKAFFRWLRLFSRMATGGMIQAYEGEYGHEKYVTDAHKNLFVYGWGYCDTTSRIAEAAWVRFKRDPASAERVCVQHENGGYHTMYRLRLDGHYGAFDPRYGYYLVDRDSEDARVLDWAGAGDDDNILRNRAYRHRSTPFFEYFGVEWERALLLQPVYYPAEEAWVDAKRPVEAVFGNRMYQPGTRYHDMDFELPRGATLERFWDNSARKFYVPAGKHTQREEAFLPSGRFYRVTESMLEGNWPKYDPNYRKAKPYLATVPADEGYNRDVAGGRTIGQAWGRIEWNPDPHRPIDFYSPYVLVDGTLSGEAGTGARIEMRTLRAKTSSAAEQDQWSSWDTLHEGAGKFAIPLGRERFDGRHASVHGVYRIQIRPVGAVTAMKLKLTFENGIMSMPQIFSGSNTIHFKLRDDSRLRAPVRIVYRYQTRTGQRRHEEILRPADFRGNQATYRIEAPDLVRCDSVAITYLDR